MASAENMRSIAREIFLHALSEAGIEKAFAHHISYQRGVLRVREDLFDMNSYSRTVCIAFGKAAHRMADLLSRQVGTTLEGIIVDPNRHTHQVPGYRYFTGGHPQPNEESIRGAEAILKTLGTLNPQSLVVFLVSGGGSAAVEKPHDSDISLPDLIATYKTLVNSGADITKINAVRKHLSAVKGGRMVQAAKGAQQVSIMVSDVPENALDYLSSGPTMPDSSTMEDCYQIVHTHNMLPDFPASVRELFEKRALEETPKQDDPAFVKSRWWKILSNETAENAAAAEVAKHGFAVEIDHSCDDWDYARAADYLLDRLRALRKNASKACIVSGGEVTVKVPANAGQGGRNQHFALYCAQKIAGENITVLSAGTDGIDGVSPAAGAVVDGTTTDRAQNAGLAVATHLNGFNAFPFFEKLDDTIQTGPTGNNVRDLRILMAH
jgi:hydroxypyruvate reductase